MQKKALVVVSFGTTYSRAREAIEKIENRLKNEFTDYDFFRAYTSKKVIKKLKAVDGIQISEPEEIFEELLEKGYDTVLCQTLHVLNGIEYEKLYLSAKEYAGKFKKFLMGRPLLTNKEDFEKCCRLIKKYDPRRNGEESYVFMGHGTEHFSNSAYCQLENMLWLFGERGVYMGTVEGFPDIEYIEKKLEARENKKVYLQPFMIVAGDHALNDMAGEEHSWKSELQKKGYTVETILKGLGEYEEIAEIFIEHGKNSEKI